jgi:hypothetical protein
MTKQKAVVTRSDTGRKMTVVIQRTDDKSGDHWATKTERNHDRGYTLFANGSAVRQEWRNGELISGAKIGTWKLA